MTDLTKVGFVAQSSFLGVKMWLQNSVIRDIKFDTNKRDSRHNLETKQ